MRTLSTDVNDNLIESDFDYGVHTPDGAIHWLVGSGANGSMLAVDGSGFQLMLTRGTAPDHSDDSAFRQFESDVPFITNSRCEMFKN